MHSITFTKFSIFNLYFKHQQGFDLFTCFIPTVFLNVLHSKPKYIFQKFILKYIVIVMINRIKILNHLIKL